MISGTENFVHIFITSKCRSDKRARKADAAAGAASARNESAKIVKLNVGGTKFTTLLSTLRAVPGSVLDRMFDEEAKYGKPIRDEDGSVFLDTDPEAFPVILNFLRFGRCVTAGLFLQSDALH